MLLNHCHVGPAGYFQRVMGKSGPWDDGSLQRLAGYLGATGFSRAVVFAPFSRWMGEEDPNAWLFDHVQDDARFVPWSTINQGGEGAVRELEACLKRGAKGVKFHPPVIGLAPDDPGLDAFYALAQEAGVPILYHAGPHGWDLDRYRPARIGKVAGRFPQLNLLVEHLGGSDFCAETWEVMERHPKVHGGLATTLLPESTWHVPTDEIKAAIRRFGAGRFVFGADFPYNDEPYIYRCRKVLETLGLSSEDLVRIESGNVESLLP